MSGKNKVTQAGMDGVAICSRASGSIGLFLALINKADEADLKNDPYLQLADDELKKAMGFDMPLNVRSCIQRARNALRLAKDIDFSDDSIHDLKKNIQPFQVMLEACEQSFRQINFRLNPQPKQTQEINLI